MILHSSDEILRRGMTRIMKEQKLSGRNWLMGGLQAVIINMGFMWKVSNRMWPALPPPRPGS